MMMTGVQGEGIWCELSFFLHKRVMKEWEEVVVVVVDKRHDKISDISDS